MRIVVDLETGATTELDDLPIDPPTIEEQVSAAIAAVDVTYDHKFDQMRKDIATVNLLGGPNMAENVAALQTKYASTWDEYSAALIAAMPEG
ncbi:hypothetical protein [Pleomorphomonas oryzae]|uniref:hypothetical protein n=1 Tax=Pleomorphomonas oryzae TaxID=261934 RepID=UPI0003FE6F85|nr:hypothetical protein [Pleomorphomonas oryzae]